MLSDTLHGIHIELKDDFDAYQELQKFYSEEISAEVDDILERIDTLRGKLDGFEYVGSMRFDDGGAYAAFKAALRNLQVEVIEQAGDLSVDFEGKQEELDEIENRVFPISEYWANYFLAMRKIGDTKYESLKQKHIGSYQQKFSREMKNSD